MRRLPLLPTLIVAVCVATMVALGIWQLGRSEEKAELIASFGAIDTTMPAVALSKDTQPGWRDRLLFRRVSLDCSVVSGMRATAGTSARGAKGWSHVARCAQTGLGDIEVALGWSQNPVQPDWNGGRVEGILDQNAKIVTSASVAGLEPLARPDPADLPNNHLAYAGQWFFFALTALVIYFFALRSRSAKGE